MKVQAEISLYPLRQDDVTKPIRQFIQILEDNNLQVKTGPMSSLVVGKEPDVFESLQKAFGKIAQKYEVVLTAKISNACPEIE